MSFLNIPLMYIRNALSHDAYIILLNSKVVIYFSFSVLIIIMVALCIENTGRKKSSFWHHRTTLSGCIFAAEACIDNRKKLVKHRYLLHVSS